MKLPSHWTELTSINQIDVLLEESLLHPVFIFKHSTRCVISRTVINQFQSMDIRTKTYYLDLLNHRNISEQIANQFKVTHQSPQLLIIKNKELIDHYSHADILKVEKL